MAQPAQQLPVTPLDAFPGFAVQYDRNDNVHFKKNVEEALGMVAQRASGSDLLADIAASKPQQVFPNGIKCIFLPMNVVYHPAGKIVKKAMDGFNPFTGEELKPEEKDILFVKELPEAPDVGYCAETVDVQAVDTSLTSNGKGSVCYMRFSNAFFVDNKGNQSPYFIVLAHELIHVLNNCTGRNHASDEEIRTVGLGKYAKEKYTENKFRVAWNVKPRTEY